MKAALTILTFLVLLAPFASAQWIPVPFPGEFHNIELFLPGEDMILAGTGLGKVYGSHDHGDSWTVIASDLPGDYAPVTGLALVGDYLVMSRAFFGEFNYRSHFDGTEWSSWQPLGYQDDSIRSFAVIGETLFAVLAGGVVQRSDDHGMTFTPVTPPGTGQSRHFPRPPTSTAWPSPGTVAWPSARPEAIRTTRASG